MVMAVAPRRGLSAAELFADAPQIDMTNRIIVMKDLDMVLLRLTAQR